MNPYMRPSLILLFSSALAWGQPGMPAVYQAHQLESDGKLHEAFRTYLSEPREEYMAARLGRQHPAEYLTLTDQLLQDADPALRTRLQLIRGELLLAAGDRAGALNAFREVSADYAGRTDYPVDPTPPSTWPMKTRMAAWFPPPGPGSYRDNWLIRRYVTLQAWSDADGEFARMWKLHRVRPAADRDFPLALQFTVDYAFYLKKRGQADRALALFEEQIFRVDLDRVMGFRTYETERATYYNVQECGIPAGSFLNYAYGEFAEAHRERDLLAALERDSRPAMQRVVAWVLLQHGDTAGALATELEAIRDGAWSETSKAIRRGAILEQFERPAEALAAYREALAGKLADLNLPDAEWIAIMGKSSTLPPESAIRSSLQGHLAKLYAAQGNQEGELAALGNMLRDEERIANLDWLQHTADRFRSTGHAAEFERLLGAELPQLHSMAARASAHWFLGDAEAAAKDVAGGGATGMFELEAWKRRFASKDKEPGRVLLDELARVHPTDVRARLEAAAAAQPQNGDWSVAEMEAATAAEMPASYSGGKLPALHMPFRSVFDVAYRLARSYEHSGEFGKLVDLALRIAREDPPFKPFQEDIPNAHYAIAMALEHAADADLEARFAPALAAPRWAPERAQLERRMGSKQPPAIPRDFGWAAKLPPGVRLLASNEDVLALTGDAKYVYTGHPWGVAVYDHTGHPVTRIALGHPVSALAAGGEALWVGTNRGLYRIDLAAFAVSLVGAANLDKPVTELALNGDSLWIGGGNLARLDVPSRELRLFALAEAGFEGAQTKWGKFLFDGPYVWVHSGSGAHRFDTRDGSWAVPYEPQTGQQLSLVAFVDGTLWATTPAPPVRAPESFFTGPPDSSIDPVTLQDSDLYLLDRVTLESKRVQMFSGGPESVSEYDGHLDGKPVFGYYRWVYNPQTGVLEPGVDWQQVVPETPFPGGPFQGRCSSWHRPDGVSQCGASSRPGPGLLLRLPDGSWFTAERSSRTDYGGYWETNVPSIPAGVGGLWFHPATGPARHVSMGDQPAASATPFADVPPSDRVYLAAPGPGGEVWLATAGGLLQTDAAFRAQRVFGIGNGLPAAGVPSAAALDGKMYFASDAGLVVYDPKTAVFNVYTFADGLPGSVERVAVAPGGQLEVATASSQGRRYPPVLFDPKSGRFSPAAEPAAVSRNSPAPPQPAIEGELPWLGGPIMAVASIGGKLVLCGTRGAVVADETEWAPPADVFAVRESGSLLEQRAAESLPYSAFAGDALARSLTDPNPFVRLMALDPRGRGVSLNATTAPVIREMLRDPLLPLRRVAFRAIAAAASPEWQGILEQGLSEADISIRDHCAYGLAKLGAPAPMSYYESILMRRNLQAAWPQGINPPPPPKMWGMGYVPALEKQPLPNVWQELAKHPTPEVLALLARYSGGGGLANPGRDSPDQGIGAAVVQYPASIEFLLHSFRRGAADWSHATFEQAVLAGAAGAIKPRLLDALRSTDRVARSNAARALGLAGDRTAIPALLVALDMPSGLSRSSIVWALGRLHATEAIGRLQALYTALTPRSDSLRAAVSVGQFGNGIYWVHGPMETVDTLETNWDALVSGTPPAPAPLQPTQEDVLTAEQVQAALKSIGAPSM
jgi:hypothetical protein